jgi:hypothetical protein
MRSRDFEVKASRFFSSSGKHVLSCEAVGGEESEVRGMETAFI